MSTSSEALRGPSSAYYTRTPNPSNPGEYDPYYDTKYRDVRQEKKRTSPWIKFGIPVLILLVIAGVVGGVLGTKLNKDKDKPTSSSSNDGNGGSSSGGNSPGGGSNTNIGVFAVSTDSYYLPVYPTADNAQAYVAPTFTPTASATAAWPTDTFAPATPQATEVRPNRPRIIAPGYKWAALPALIEKDPYLKSFNDHIIANATEYRNLPAVRYVMDGGSGILDVAREIKMRVKAFAYAYRMTNNTQWIDAAWRELAHAAGADTNNPWGGPADDPWNQGHFLDVAELTAAFAIAYDWLYDSWTPDQRGLLRDTIVSHGLQPGLAAHNGAGYGWWTGGAEVASGNWNCVCNSGLTLGALAIMGDDTSGIAAQILAATIPNANRNCVQGPSSDGTWRETPNYWYFGTTGHAEMTSALLTATGSDMGMLQSNPAFNLTALYHIYVFGMTSLFDYADHGPNKFSATANSVMLYGSLYNIPMYQLYQRDRFDAASDPWNMFWYDPSVRGAWWNGLPLDRAFTDPDTKWASMRSSWTDNNGLYVAMKSSKLTGFQAHGDLDCGDFVLDAMGQRWAGELGSGDYLSTGYFNSENNDAQRWLYYRKRTEGQNTLMLGNANQVAQSADPTLEFESTGESQGSSPVISLAGTSTAYVRTDMSSAYGGGTTSVVRGVRLLNGRRQVLVQDDVSSGDAAVQWRMHTNATVTTTGGTATLTLNGKTLTMRLLSPSGTSFETAEPVRLASDPALPDGQVDQPNPGVTVVVVNVPAGQNSIQVLFDPQWDGMAAGDFVTPTSVPVGQWTLTSH